MPDEAMPSSRPGQGAEEMERDGMTVEVGDEPAARGDPLHPADKACELLIRHVMRRLRADDEVDGTFRLEIEDVAGSVIDANTGRRRSAGNRLAHGVEVNANQVDGPVSAAAP